MNPITLAYGVLLFLSVLGCSSDSSGLIPESQMADLLNDIALGEAHAETLYMKDSTLNKDSVLQHELDIVLALHKVDPLEFSQSYTHYTKDPVRFKSIIDSASERIIRKRDQVYSSEVKQPK